MRAILQSKEPHITCWLRVEGTEREIEQLTPSLEAAGWEKGHPLPQINDKISVEFSKRGTEVFGGWTEGERRRFLRQVRQLLRTRGIWASREKLTLAELL